MEVRLALLAALLLSCAPSQHNPQRYGTVTVGFGPSLDGTLAWRDDQLTHLRAEVDALAALGPLFVTTGEGSARIVVRPFYSGARCELGAGRWLPGTAFVEVDAACCHGYAELRAAVGHEIAHVMGMHHVCMTAGEVPDCSPVGYGPALMNPSLAYGDPLDQSTGFTGIGTDVPTALDLAEFRRVRP